MYFSINMNKEDESPSLKIGRIHQQSILTKGLNFNSKRALGLAFNCIWGRGGGTDRLSPVSPPSSPQGKTL